MSYCHRNSIISLLTSVLFCLSVPCKPTNVKASLQCHSNIIAVTWERASGALSYRAVGVTADGSHTIECENTETYCDLSDVQCGQTYTVSVFSMDDSCTSVESDKAYVRTGIVNHGGPNSIEIVMTVLFVVIVKWVDWLVSKILFSSVQCPSSLKSSV